MRFATREDLPVIMEMVAQTVAEMHSYGNPQWDDTYPREQDFMLDIDRQELFITERGGCIAGFICINRIEPSEYAAVRWSSASPALVIHRMVVGKNFQRQGVGSELILHADDLARRQQISQIRTDTNSMNAKAQGAFEKCGFRQTGMIRFRGLDKPFLCYEKLLPE